LITKIMKTAYNGTRDSILCIDCIYQLYFGTFSFMSYDCIVYYLTLGKRSRPSTFVKITNIIHMTYSVSWRYEDNINILCKKSLKIPKGSQNS
jgi:hypothetical protein